MVLGSERRKVELYVLVLPRPLSSIKPCGLISESVEDDVVFPSPLEDPRCSPQASALTGPCICDGGVVTVMEKFHEPLALVVESALEMAEPVSIPNYEKFHFFLFIRKQSTRSFILLLLWGIRVLHLFPFLFLARFSSRGILLARGILLSWVMSVFRLPCASLVRMIENRI